ncbi:MAG: DUF1638 domain-containing protein [Deltaproteobacteria bacterium]|jgi:hypothetical protein|nr:DUF1638 domain-containing protein [Deltaproteobacteria bacterium]
MKQKRVIIKCGMFDEELERALKPLTEEYDISYIRLHPGYHCNIEELQMKLEEALASDIVTDKNQVRIFYGCKCLPDMVDFAKKHEVKVLPTSNCLSAMVGDKELVELEKDRTMVLTPSWISKFFLTKEDAPASFLRWDEADFKINFGRYDRCLILETTAPPTDEEILEIFDLFGNPVIETTPCPPDHFNNLVKEFMA